MEKRDYNLAKELAEQHLIGPKTSQYGTYLSFGDIHIEFSQQGTTLSQVTDYQRQLNISKALVTTSYVYKERDLNVKLLRVFQMISWFSVLLRKGRKL